LYIEIKVWPKIWCLWPVPLFRRFYRRRRGCVEMVEMEEAERVVIQSPGQRG
jgi:hypothetical protein